METILAEKIETTLSRSTANTRMRDFYDLFILSKTQAFNASVVRQTLDATAKKRSFSAMLEKVEIILLAPSAPSPFYSSRCGAYSPLRPK